MSDAAFTLEKQRVTERLGAVEQELVRFATKLDVQSALMSEMIQQHQAVLYGTNGEKGLVTRVDRVEQFKQGVEKHLLGLWTAIVGGAVKLIVDVFRH